MPEAHLYRDSRVYDDERDDPLWCDHDMQDMWTFLLPRLICLHCPLLRLLALLEEMDPKILLHLDFR